MHRIPNTARDEISSIVKQLHDVAKSVEPAEPELASIYRTIGDALDGSHYKFNDSHSLHFQFKTGCWLQLAGSDSCSMSGPATFTVKVETSDTPPR